MTVETTVKFWDCECNKDFIHSKHENGCPRCGRLQEDAPDSRVNETKGLNAYEVVFLTPYAGRYFVARSEEEAIKKYDVSHYHPEWDDNEGPTRFVVIELDE